MAISQFTSSKPSTVQTSSTIKVNKKWEAKKKLARQRLADLETTTTTTTTRKVTTFFAFIFLLEIKKKGKKNPRVFSQ
ncbi:hypothetical protein RHMOL_Rhmol05G0100900 [Rhododendron molle]|uniref:Uncharacterized protein n=1 Tax=Rhododendron molle TaxID=49168 RepID=A0ACC0NNB1_RHOML|nr:hypothetical protein RHMOL_Rhmol05G0100900 [Rhododendron molle]